MSSKKKKEPVLTECRGYVALAVSTEKGDFTREVEDLGSDREANMVNFAVEALKLLKDVIKGDAKL